MYGQKKLFCVIIANLTLVDEFVNIYKITINKREKREFPNNRFISGWNSIKIIFFVFMPYTTDRDLEVFSFFLHRNK